jgi:glycosyltransferase involved in cell wall biosynthesis
MGPAFYFLKEAWVKSVFLNQQHFINWLSFTCIHRVILKKNLLKKITEEIGSGSILYFYWADKPSGIVPFLRKKFTNPMVVRFHGSDVFEEVKGGYIPCRESLLKSLNVAVFISQKGENYVHDKYPALNFASLVFRLGVKYQGKTKISSDGVFRIVSCSNVVKLKRVNLILEALIRCSERVHWVHFGEGPLLEALKEKSKNINDNLTITFKGQVPGHEIYEYYRNEPVDLFINVSKSEGIPVSIMEALSFGIPVIATDVGGVSEIVSNSIGRLLSKDFQTKELAEIIENFQKKSEEEISIYKENAYKVWENNYNAQNNYLRFANFLFSMKHD